MHIKYKPVPYVESNYDQLFADGHYEEAIDFMLYFLSEHEGNPYAEMIAHINIASCYYCIEKIDLAFEHALQYKQLCNQYGNEQDYYNLCHISALIYQYEQNYTKAAEAIQECIQIASQLDLYLELAESYNLYSYILNILEQHEDSLQAALKAQQIAYEHHNEKLYLICQIHCNIAAAYMHLKRYSEAQNMLILLSTNPYIQSSLQERSRFLYLQGIIQMNAKDYHSAVTFFAESRRIVESLRDLPILKRLLLSLADTYEAMDNYKYAYQTMKEYGILCEQIIVLRNQSNVEEIHLNHSVAIWEQRANIDHLSGIYNRNYLENICDEWLTEAKNNHNHIGCIAFDVDNFKDINDQYGHLVGDEVIKQLGQTLLSFIKTENEIAGRYGGDEFVIILKNYTMDEIIQTSREIFEALTSTIITYENYSIQFTISMGIICNSSIIANKFTQLFKVADQALYMAKNQGKNQIVTLTNNNCCL